MPDVGDTNCPKAEQHGTRKGAICQTCGFDPWADSSGSDTAVRRQPLTCPWPIHDDGVEGHWLCPGRWTRGAAISHVAREELHEHAFTAYRAHRVYYRWQFGAYGLRGWSLDDGMLVECERTDSEAESYWEVTLV